MTFAGWFTIAAFAVVLTVLAFPLGTYMAKVYTGERVFLSPMLGRSRASHVSADQRRSRA